MPTKTWTGNGSGNNWTTAGNWFPSAPSAGDDIVFDGLFPLTGNKDCVYNTAISIASINFTGYTGQFTFSNSIIITGNITLNAGGGTYVTSATVTTYTLTTGAASTLTFNGKSLPVNYSPAGSGTQTFVGDADFQGNYVGAGTGYNIKAALLTTINLRIGGNISFGAAIINVTDHVTLRAYGTNKTFAASTITTSQRVVFVNGSSYTNSGNPGSGLISFYTVEAGGRFNSANTTSFFTVATNGTLTLSGFNSSNNSDFMNIAGAGVYNILNDTVIKGFINITTNPLTINSPTGGKILLEGNFIAAGGAVTVIDKLEFSGATASNITVVSSSNNLQVKEFIINKTGGGSVNFNSAGIFSLTTAASTTNLFTYTNGIVTQSSSCVIRFVGSNSAATITYSATTPLNTLRYIEVSGGTLNLNSQLTVTTLLITPATATITSITSPSSFGFTVEELRIINISGAARTVTLKSGVTYTVTASFIGLTTNPALLTTLNASIVGTRANLNVDSPGVPNVEYINATDIDSSGTNGALPYTKVPIYSLGGTIAATTRNWNTGNQPPPVLPSRTVAYTFVN